MKLERLDEGQPLATIQKGECFVHHDGIWMRCYPVCVHLKANEDVNHKDYVLCVRIDSGALIHLSKTHKVLRVNVEAKEIK